MTSFKVIIIRYMVLHFEQLSSVKLISKRTHVSRVWTVTTGSATTKLKIGNCMTKQREQLRTLNETCTAACM